MQLIMAMEMSYVHMRMSLHGPHVDLSVCAGFIMGDVIDGLEAYYLCVML